MALEVFFFPGIGIAEAEEEGVVADRADAEDGDIGVAAEFQDAPDVAVAVDHFLDFLRIEEDRQGQVLGDSFVILGEFFQDFVGVRFTRRQGDAPFELDDLGALQGVGDELVREAVQRRTPADADDVAVLDDFVDIGRAALADVFLHFFFVFNRRIGDADIAQAIGSGDFFCQLALVLDGIEDFDTDEALVFGVLQESRDRGAGKLKLFGDISLTEAGLIIQFCCADGKFVLIVLHKCSPRQNSEKMQYLMLYYLIFVI